MVNMPHPTGPTDPNLQKLVHDLKRKREKFYLTLAKHLEKSRRRKEAVNVGKIDKYAQPGEIVVVPGKVLGGGEMTKKTEVYAWVCSKSAREKIARAGGSCHSLDKVLELKQKGRILL